MVVTTCSKCGGCMQATSADLEHLFQVVEVAPTRAEAPNATVCRAALRASHGPKRAKQLIDLFLKDQIIPATKAYPRRHVMLFDKQPLRPKKLTPHDEPTQQTNQ